MSSHSRSGPHLRRTGAEPKEALSAYGMRLGLSLGGLVVFTALALWALLAPDATDTLVVLGVASAVIAVVALADVVLVVRGMRRSRPRHRG
ncbi:MULTISPECIES: DUF6343 family protein [Mumia]|uniref:DUF6343 family protein n=1 Tax=Mumia TaxID=1546255 RepID=UPI0014213AB4|nr:MULTISPECIES: DUF6343 family protein [unclassified Mumia]QMW64927.1 hypothetical protein H4N58_11845 [Mumia sp. ZJ1417]